MKVRVERQIGASILSIETGELAKQAAGSCLVQYGETVVLSAVASGGPRPGDFFPLTCDYRERVAAAGKFPGGFLKREGRPTTKETLTARLMDRPIRPLFPDGYKDEVQIQSFVLASDRQNDGDVLAMNGASAALRISPLPFLGPIGSVRLASINGEFVAFPTHDALEESDLDLIVSGSKESILMIEGFAREMPEDRMVEAIALAHGYIRQICEMQEELAAKVGTVKKEYVAPPPDGVFDKLRAKYYDAFRAAKQTEGKLARAEACAELKKQAIAELIPDPKADGAISADAFASAWEQLETRAIRDQILTGTRPDGRNYTQPSPAGGQGRSAAPRSRLGPVPARRDAGVGHRHARHRPRRAARRRADRGILAEVHAALLLPVVFGRRVPSDPRPRPPRNRPRRVGRAQRQAGSARARRLPLHDPHHLRHPREQRVELDGERLRGHARTDGRRRADQQSRGRHLRRPGQRARPLRPA